MLLRLVMLPTRWSPLDSNTRYLIPNRRGKVTRFRGSSDISDRVGKRRRGQEVNAHDAEDALVSRQGSANGDDFLFQRPGSPADAFRLSSDRINLHLFKSALFIASDRIREKIRRYRQKSWCREARNIRDPAAAIPSGKHWKPMSRRGSAPCGSGRPLRAVNATTGILLSPPYEN